MGKLTDEDIEQLLRETFAGKENLVDELPPATKRRNPGPVLLAAAAVLVVLTGVQIAGKADHVEVDVSLFHDCNHWTWAKYRIEKHETWVVTATLDQRTQAW